MNISLEAPRINVSLPSLSPTAARGGQGARGAAMMTLPRTLDFNTTFGHTERMTVGRSASLPCMLPDPGPPQAHPDADRILLPATFRATIGPPKNVSKYRKDAFGNIKRAWRPACGRYAKEPHLANHIRAQQASERGMVMLPGLCPVACYSCADRRPDDPKSYAASFGFSPTGRSGSRPLGPNSVPLLVPGF